MKEKQPSRVPQGLPADATSTFDPTCSWIKDDDRAAEADEETIQDSSVAAGDTQEPGHSLFAVMSSREYRLHRKIGRGGFGEVWEATQVSLNRTVALKRLREDSFSGVQSSRRLEDFRCEALTAAALEHPNIVPVYDAAEDDRGRPQLALKLVRGTTWQEQIEADQRLELDKLLQRHLPILIDVAQAVAYAHSRGVIHRDIKPSQVLLGEFGEVLLVDWGLALHVAALTTTAGAQDEDSTASNGYDPTSSSSFRISSTATCPAGTPAYMAPEQTDDVPDRLGPWTDVYLLGGVLYYLLTGTPLRVDVSAAGAFLQASLGEIEPPRQRSPHRDIPDDLETLVIRALAADPEQRPSAGELIMALQDHLSGAHQRRESDRLTDEVEATLPSAAGSYGALSHCLAELARASGLWQANPRVGELRERLLSLYAWAAMGNGDLELARYHATQLLDQDRRSTLEAEIERRAAELRRTAVQRRLYRGISLVLGVALCAFSVKYIADQHRAQERLEQQRNAAVTAREQAEGLTTFMLEDLTPNLEALGRLDLLDQVARRSIDYYALLPTDATGPQVMQRRSLALRNAARVLRDQGQLEQARTAMDSSLVVARELVRLEPDNLEYQAHLATCLLELGALMRRTADPDAAFDAFDEGVRLYQRLLEQKPDSVRLRRGLAQGLAGNAYELWAKAALEESFAALTQSIVLLDELVTEHPEDHRSTQLLLESYARLGGVQRDRGELDESATVTRRAIELGDGLLKKDPTNILCLSSLAECTSSLGFTLWQMDDLAGSLQAYRRSLDINRELAARDPTNQDRQAELGSAYSNVGELRRRLGNEPGALASFREALATLEPLVERNPDQAEWRYILAVAYLEMGTLRDSLGHHRAAEEEWARAVSVMEKVALQRGDLYYLDTYARALLLLGRVEQARPVVETLLAKQWRSPPFIELCQRHGIDTTAGAAPEANLMPKPSAPTE